MIRKLRTLSIFMAVIFFISGCSTLSTLSSTQPDVSIRIMEKPYAPMPVKEELSVRTFGSYHFVAEKKGADPLYGIIPLYVKVENIILDALFSLPWFCSMPGAHTHFMKLIMKRWLFGTVMMVRIGMTIKLHPRNLITPKYITMT